MAQTQSQLITIPLNRQEKQPWGFRLQGGRDRGLPLSVLKVNMSSLADHAGLMAGDIILKINNKEVYTMTHNQAQDALLQAGDCFEITVQRGAQTWRPTVTATGPLPNPSVHNANIGPVTKTSLAYRPQEVRHIGSGYNNAARPFSTINSSNGQVKSIVNKQYNSPVGIYSEEAIAETLSAQAEVLAGGVLGVNFKKNEKVYNAANSEVLKALHEQENDPQEPAIKSYDSPQSHYHQQQHQLQHQQHQQQHQHQQHQQQHQYHHQPVHHPHHHQQQQQQQQQYHHQPPPHHQQQKQQQHQYQNSASVTRHVNAPIDRPNKAPSTGGLPVGQNICSECERLLTGVFVRIKDKNLHVECFKCATCGTPLKNQGYFNINNKLYCDIHAKLAAMNNPPPGTEGYVPVPIQPTSKLSANIINAAFDRYHGQSNGGTHYSNASPISNANTNFVAPKPFGASPPVSAQRSPTSYPPQSNTQNWSQQQQQQPITRQQVNANPYATLPRTSGPGQQAVQQISCSKEECQQKSHEIEQKVSFPPPVPAPIAKKALTSGLHKPETIPQYQRNWTVLPSQRPVRTPEPQELKENVPLAFVDVPRERSPSVQRQTNLQSITSSAQSNANSAGSDATKRPSEAKSQSSVPVIVEQRVGPITMTFQSLDEQKSEDHSQAHPRPFTPSLINKPAPIIPFYQTPEKLVFEECQPTTSHPFDRRSASPYPDRARSPAPGPPPNPLSAIRAPRIKDEEGYRNLQVGSITTGQSCYASQALQQQHQEAQVLSHYQTANEYGVQSFIDKPEIVQQKQIGNTTIQTREKERHLNEEQRKELQSKTTTQVGNTQIERHRKVVEEFEHTQSAKTIEIQKTSGSTIQQTRQQQYGKTGFVANQARRLSNLEQEISSLSSQSQAISARAANLGAVSPSSFPFFKSPEPVSKFPLKPDLPPHDEPKAQAYIVSPDSGKKLVGPPPGFQRQQKQQEQKQATLSSQYSSYASSSVAQSSSATQSLLASNSNKTSSASNFSTAIPVPAFKPPVSGTSDALYGETGVQQPSSNNNTYKPTPSIGPAGFKPPQQPASQVSSNINPSVVVSDPSPASAGPNKGGAFGATSAPKRGRGILNKAVGPGVRIPLCGCCNTQIRGPFITALGRIWCPDHFVCVRPDCRRALQDIGFVEENGNLYCEFCFEKYLAPECSKCRNKIKGDCLNAIAKHFHPECFSCAHCGKLFGNTPFFLEEGEPYCEVDWNELFTTKCFACGFPVEAGDRWVEALNHNYHSQCFNCTMCKKNLEGQSFYNKGGRPFCKNHAR